MYSYPTPQANTEAVKKMTDKERKGLLKNVDQIIKAVIKANMAGFELVYPFRSYDHLAGLADSATIKVQDGELYLTLWQGKEQISVRTRVSEHCTDLYIHLVGANVDNFLKIIG